MPFVSGFLRFRRGGHPDQGLPPVSGGYPDQGLPPTSGGYPDQGLPGAPAYPDQGLPPGLEYPDQGLPTPPPGVWPPPSIHHPIVPAPPGTPPGAIWPPPAPAHPWLPPTGTPPASGGAPDQTLPGNLPAPSHPIASPPEQYWVVAGIPGIGWRYVCIKPAYPAHPVAPTTPPAPQPV